VTRFLILLLVAIGCLSLSATLVWIRSADPGLPDFSRWPAGETRKQQFFQHVRPLLEAENELIRTQRAHLQRVAATAGSAESGVFDRRWLGDLARQYALDPDATSPQELITELLLRVDTVPVSLGLAQAAKESGWGTSRFAAAGNALFGQRCFEAGCGMLPADRVHGASHEVTAFSSPRAAVASYLRNLNTHPDYQELRQLRAQLRGAGQRVSGFTLARTLTAYSERRDEYIDEIRQMIRFNELGPATSDE
jgi:Bax protein